MNVLPDRKANIPRDRKCEFAIPIKPLQAVQDLQNSPTFRDFAEKEAQIDSVAVNFFGNIPTPQRDGKHSETKNGDLAFLRQIPARVLIARFQSLLTLNSAHILTPNLASEAKRLKPQEI